MNIPLIRRKNFLATHRALHKLWSAAVDQPGYDKSLWLALDQAIAVLGSDGPGDLDDTRSEDVEIPRLPR